MKKILVLNGRYYYRAVKHFGMCVFDIDDFYENPKDYLFVLFTGGEDVHPSLYNDNSPFGICGPYNKMRDTVEKEVFNVAYKNNVKMIGICRGLQFLAAMAGGSLIHHIENHGGWDGGHEMLLKTPWEGKKSIVVNSYHHQAVLPIKGVTSLVGWAPKKIANGTYIGFNDARLDYKGPDVEAMYFHNINGFGVQWHPESLEEDTDAYRWFNYEVEKFVYNKGTKIMEAC